MRGNHTFMFLSLSFSLPSPVSKSKIKSLKKRKSEIPASFAKSENLATLDLSRVSYNTTGPERPLPREEHAAYSGPSLSSVLTCICIPRTRSAFTLGSHMC